MVGARLEDGGFGPQPHSKCKLRGSEVFAESRAIELTMVQERSAVLFVGSQDIVAW